MVHKIPPRSGQLYVATELAVINAEFMQTLILRLQIGDADVVVVVADEVVILTVVSVVGCGVLLPDEPDV